MMAGLGFSLAIISRRVFVDDRSLLDGGPDLRIGSLDEVSSGKD